MGFFDDIPTPEPPQRGRHHQPPWLGPPENAIGGVAPLRVVLARAERAAVAVLGATAFPEGVLFDLDVRLRVEDDEELVDPFGHRAMHRRRRDDPWPPPDVLRFGVAWPDGRKATTLGRWAPFGRGEPEGPVLHQRGGGGGGASWSQRLWLWPLPPPGTIELVCEWPSEGIAETRVAVPTAPLLDAAAQAETLWPDGGHSGGGLWVQSEYSD